MVERYTAVVGCRCRSRGEGGRIYPVQKCGETPTMRKR